MPSDQYRNAAMTLANEGATQIPTPIGLNKVVAAVAYALLDLADAVRSKK